MVRLLIVVVFGGLYVLAWRVVGMVAPDAVAMAVGVLLGVFAGVPVALLVMAGRRSAPPPAAPMLPRLPSRAVVVLGNPPDRDARRRYDEIDLSDWDDE